MKFSEYLEGSENFKQHKMYYPETGKEYDAKTYEDHMRMKKLGYTHEKPDSLKESKDDELLATVIQFGDNTTKPFKDTTAGGWSVMMNGGNGKRYLYNVKDGIVKEFIESKPKSNKFKVSKKTYKTKKDLLARVKVVVDGE